MAAGLGFKTFTTGEVLTAADTNGYLMQGVLVFASSAARAAAITSPQEGQYSYLKDTNSTEYYDGAAWIAAPIGDITGVTAGTGISGGGTSGTVTITNSMATEITAKGDLIAGTGSATFDNLPVGTNGQTLVADSTASTGLKWATPATPASGALTLVKAETAFSAVANTSTTFDGVFSSSYNNYLIIINQTLNSVDGESFNFNMRYSTGTTDSDAANTGGTYVKNSSGTDGSWYFNNATTMKLFTNQNTAGRFGTCNLYIGGLNSGSASRYQMNWQFATPGNNQFGNGGNVQNSNGTTRIWTGFILTASSGTISGTATVYGFGKA